MLVKVPVTQQEIEFLAKRGYEAKKDDPASVSDAVSLFLSDSAVHMRVDHSLEWLGPFRF